MTSTAASTALAATNRSRRLPVRLTAIGTCLIAGLWNAGFAMSAAEPPASGEAVPAFAALDELLTDFLKQHDIPAAQAAVGRDGKVVYSRAFGWSDAALSKGVRTDSLFRIASISKPITGVAILQLVEAGKLSLDDRVFDILAEKFPLPEKHDPRLKEVTIRHLLTHRGGWDRDTSFDPMFVSARIVEETGCPAPAMPPQIINWMGDKPLQFDPGSRYAYSNYGYSLLGRVIEERTGKTYEKFVLERTLAPLGIRHMKLGKTLPSDRDPHEVHYSVPPDSVGPAVMGPQLGKPVPQPDGAWSVEAFDAHGGWLATAEDLVRFGMAAASEDSPLFEKRSTYEAMLAPSPGEENEDTYYGLGWRVRRVDATGRKNFWHFGGIPGTSTLLVVRHDGWVWSVLFNRREKIDGQDPAAVIDPLLHPIITAAAAKLGKGN